MADHDEVRRSPSGRLTPRTIAGGVIAAVAVAFMLANSDEVTIDFVVVDSELPLWLALALTFALGLAVGALFFGRGRAKKA